MMKRTCGMVLRFTRAELDALTQKARSAHMSRESFCRDILNGAEVKEVPHVNDTTLIWELRRVGNNLNQILVKANTAGFIDAPMLRKVLDETHTVEDKITEVFTTQTV